MTKRLALVAAVVALCAATATAEEAVTYENAPIADVVELAESGDRLAMLMAAHRYFEGIGVPRNREQYAYAEWLSQAGPGIAAGDGLVFRVNDENEATYIQAHAWANLGAMCGDEHAVQLRDHLDGKLDEDQEHAGEVLAAELFLKYFGGAVDCDEDRY